MEMRAAALILDNRGHANLPIDQMTHQKMSHTPLTNQGGLSHGEADETASRTQRRSADDVADESEACRCPSDRLGDQERSPPLKEAATEIMQPKANTPFSEEKADYEVETAFAAAKRLNQATEASQRHRVAPEAASCLVLYVP